MRRKIFLGLVFILALLIRIIGLNLNPPSPYWEEVALGYDAYSILQTGKDHHGNQWPILAFESFGDWKPSLYFYVLVPFIKIFGLNVWAVRLPAAVCGTLTALGSGVLIYLLFLPLAGKRTAQWLGLLGTLIATLNPWLIQFSRGGWEISLATTLILWGVISWLWATRLYLKKPIFNPFFMIATALLAVSMYAQHAARVVAPLMVVLLICRLTLNLKKKFKQIKPIIYSLVFNVISACLVALVISLPLVTNIFSKQVGQRFSETSIFSNLEVIERSNYYKELCNNSLLSRIIYHRSWLFAKQIGQNFFKHFSLDYLFLSGDSNPRHSTQFFGLFYHLDLPLLLLGFYYLFSKNRSVFSFVCCWIVIATLPASIATGAPHALRTLIGLPAWMVLIASGGAQIQIIARKIKIAKRMKKIIAVVFIMLYLAEFAWFWRFYQRVYPKLYANHWQYGYEQMVKEISRLRQNNPMLPIYVSREQGRPAMYYWFFSKTDPNLVQQENKTAPQDQGEFLNFQNIQFIDRADQIQAKGQFILAASDKFSSSLASSSATSINNPLIIKDLSDKIVWQIGIYQK